MAAVGGLVWLLGEGAMVADGRPQHLLGGLLWRCLCVLLGAGAGVVTAAAGAIFVTLFTLTQNKWKIDDVLGVWPLHGLCGAWGGIACGIFGLKALGGLGGVAFGAQVLGTGMAVAIALAGGTVVYSAVKLLGPLRLSAEQEFEGADISIHNITATPETDW